jgi:hypothetical protein
MAWAPDYATTPEAKDFLRIDDAEDDTFLALAVTAASRSVDRFTHRQFGKTDGSETRTYEVEWDCDEGLWVASIDDLMTTAGLVVTVDGAPLAASDYRLLPRNADKKGRPWEELGTATATVPTLGGGRRTIDVTANPWGWTSVPAAVTANLLIHMNEVFAAREAPFDNELRLLAKLHPVAEVGLRDYRRIEYRP